MQILLSLREYDDADIIAYMQQVERGKLSRTIREALRLKMREEGFLVNRLHRSAPKPVAKGASSA